MFETKIDILFGWLFLVTILLLYPIFLLNDLVHNIRRMFDKKYNKKWLDIASKINNQLITYK